MTCKLAAMLLTSLSLVAGMASSVAAADFAEVPVARHTYDVGVCGNPSVLGFITRRFDYKAANYLRANIAIAEIREMGQSRFEPRDYTHLVEREYCYATAVTTDGVRRPMWYLIERPWGFAGVGSNIEFCVGGLDPWYVYGANCASLR
ncbi:hypothetical protein HR059_04810 [Sinorhizobium meliloti WSM1022]|jgi:hypothetical protein|uniref:Uncharacterized protein n=5 Tax=Sinorhizobium TaxID=28105 RepID=H0G3R2_RHIML|nr:MULTISPECIES: hypothetical protein [Sinorhizobium]TWA97924.1 hypothetical protein FB000_11219 [Ensifer sp. SEMIA 134]TWB33584.1 hypothetical protein FB001_112152 [Ensifer sp. SEMIA 135]AEG03733.1 hypothetical protein SinmeB_0802 [Sinorhizobium meliloti BL225C]AEG52725.1 hypothetical protein Sinme_0973 [Sinorhizobium meliloti AK83]AGA06147.1 hypothetical protein C770_GR4Chr1186 [Sinorhizobium meliloti GR4]